MSLDYPKIKTRFPKAYLILLEYSKEHGITEIRRLVYEYLKANGESDSFSLIADLKNIEECNFDSSIRKEDKQHNNNVGSHEFLKNTFEILEMIFNPTT